MKNRKRIIFITALVLMLLSADVVFAWYTIKSGVVTMTRIKKPGDLSIDGVHGQSMQLLDLSYSDDDVAADGKVHVKTIVCIGTSSEDYNLEVAQTTNIDGLIINIYPATESASNPGGTYVKGTCDGTDYYYSYDAKNGFTTGSVAGLTTMVCLNEKSDKIAESTGFYHNETYSEEENRVQKNAEPLYYSVSTKLNPTAEVFVDQGRKYDNDYAGFYVIEAVWNEKDKETDIIYILAETVDTVESSN